MRKRYYKGRTEEDVAEILDYYFSHANKRQAAPLGKRKTPAGFSGGKGQMVESRGVEPRSEERLLIAPTV